MRSLMSALVAVSTLAVLVPTAALARGNPYTARELCGSSFSVIDRERLYDVSPIDGRRYHLSTLVLLYSGVTGENCAVNLKRRRIDKPDQLDITLITRPSSDANSDGDGGVDLGFFAGPVKVYAPDKCVQWWGGTTQKHRKHHATVDLHGGFRSGWVHCR
jgi:hypothetical protein